MKPRAWGWPSAWESTAKTGCRECALSIQSQPSMCKDWSSCRRSQMGRIEEPYALRTVTQGALRAVIQGALGTVTQGALELFGKLLPVLFSL